MGRHELRIVKQKSTLVEALAQFGEGDLGCVCSDVKHRFTEESAPKRNTVEPADEGAIFICLDAVCQTKNVQLLVGGKNLAGDPGLVSVCAGSHHRGEIAVEQNLEPVPPQ